MITFEYRFDVVGVGDTSQGTGGVLWREPVGS